MGKSDQHHNRILRNEKGLEDLKRMVEKMKKDGSATPSLDETPAPLKRGATVTNVTFEDLENAASAAGSGPVGDLLNKILTYMRKIELSVVDKSDKEKCQSHYDELSNEIATRLTANSSAAVITKSSAMDSGPKGGAEVNPTDKKKWDDAANKIQELQKSVMSL